MKLVFFNEIILSEDTIVHTKNSDLFIMVLNSKPIFPCFFHKTGEVIERGKRTEDVSWTPDLRQFLGSVLFIY